jgi:hypothetical protein
MLSAGALCKIGQFVRAHSPAGAEHTIYLTSGPAHPETVSKPLIKPPQYRAAARSICRFCIATFLGAISVISGGLLERSAGCLKSTSLKGPPHVEYKISFCSCYFGST